MDTNALKKFAQAARNLLIDQVASKLDVVLAEGSAARREAPKAVKDLENAINKADKQQVIEQVAYTWFNRFTALRFMDANGYSQVRTVSPADGATRPELLSEAMAGNLPDGAPTTIQSLLDGRTPSHDPQAEAYRLLLVHTCNQWHGPMPFLFEEIDDYTELLMPEDLLSQTSILAELRKVMTEDACKDVEIIGWLYQFYISEKKDEVFAGLKKNQKITAENIPAATQLFTPHWIVRYLVENSLGQLWLLNNPDSGLAAKMDYYIAPEEPETDFLKITKPEEIRICDPAAGSGHMLTYAFDLLYAIYEEEGYDATEIPALILTHNLTGVEIDDRAGALAAFALAMKAAARLGRRRFLRMEAKPDICVLQNVAFTDAEMQDVAAVVGKDLFTDELRETLGQFEQAKNFGSLIVPKLRDPAETLRVVAARDFGGDLLLKEVQERVIAVLRMAEALSPKYHVVVANPPYMGGKGMTATTANWLKDNYPDGKADLFAAFIERGLTLISQSGFSSMVTMESWMFLFSYEAMRSKILSHAAIHSMVHMPYLGKGGTSMGINFGTVAFVLEKKPRPDLSGEYVCVRYYETDSDGVPLNFPVENERRSSVPASEFTKIPGGPIAYWVSADERDKYASGELVSSVAEPRKGIDTGDNNLFLRAWHEPSAISFSELAGSSDVKWFPYNKGGDFRRWYGNREFLVNWQNNGSAIKARLDWKSKKPTIRNKEYFFREGFTWTTVSSGGFSARWTPEGAMFDNGGCTLFSSDHLMPVGAFLNSAVMKRYLAFLSPTLNFQPGDIGKALFLEKCLSQPLVTGNLIELARSDWDAYETSWDFTSLPLLSVGHRGETLADSYATLRAHWQSMTDEMQRLEEENNRIFIDAYGLQDELTPEVPLNEITLTCNPVYSIKGDKTDAARDADLCKRTMEEFLSYAVGCSSAATASTPPA
ncbi:BREX-1 system adenine-specific DNA-methyltransferase PglX [Parasphingorhabdus sp. JC815]|uniref:BREX-1 system adenine-specific DNA-methyltransferase PglX n=1 Tax=Parasphingorhabdus sp. JC815 TaxID=3232140 RepID=UPI00345A2E24